MDSLGVSFDHINPSAVTFLREMREIEYGFCIIFS